MSIDPNIESDYILATPDKTIVNAGGKPIKKPKNTTTTNGKKVSEDEALAKLTTQLPDVKGYRILCMVPEADEKYESGLIKSDSVKQIQEHSTVVLFVMQLGDLAYQDEAIAYAQKVAEQNKKLQSTLSTGEEDYIKTVLSSAEAEVNLAKREYREAYESGETDAIVEAQAKMNEAQMKLSQAKGLKPQYTPSQTEQNSVESNQQQVRSTMPKPDAKAQAWQEQNTWFGKDEEMTSLALGLHEKLVRNGIDPTSDAYYRRIDETMQKRFPENFGDNSLEPEEKPAQRKPSNVVAPATRSTAPKKVRLSKTQVAFAKKLKLTPEQYAREMIKLENANG